MILQKLKNVKQNISNVLIIE